MTERITQDELETQLELWQLQSPPGQLRRLWERWKIDPAKISSIRLIPNGRSAISEVTYSSQVTMTNGDEIFIPNINIRSHQND